ncbi:hypothetical protein D3C84_973890 [compost metagenome]
MCRRDDDSTRLAHHAHINAQVHQFGMGADLQFALEQRQVVGNGFAADIQLLGDLARRSAFGEHYENLQFALGHAVQA